MHKLKTFVRYFKDFLQFGQLRLVFAAIVYILTKKSFIETRIIRGKLGYFLHRRGTLDFQFGNYAYEWGVKLFMNKYYKNYDVFIDVGANIGTYSVMLASKGLRTYAFEPVYENWKALKINLMLNNLEKKATAFNVGLSNASKTAGFVFDPLNTGASHIDSLPAEDEDAENRGIHTSIELVLFDSVLPKMEIDDKSHVLMKIDVEGMEAEVIEGASSFIRSHPNLMIVMESVHSGEEKLKEILNQFAEFEFIKVDALNFAAHKTGNLMS